MKHPNIQRARVLRLSVFVALILIIGTVFFVLRLVGEKASSSKRPNHATTPTPTRIPSSTVEPLFEDTFVDNSRGWSVVRVPGYMRAIHDGALTLSDTSHTVLVESLPTTTVFSDFALTMTFTLIQADANDSVGLYIRGDSNLDHDYRIDIFGNNTYAISRETLNTNNDLDQMFLAQPTHTTLLNALGQKNTLTITMQGPAMVITLNGKMLHSLTDTKYKRGQIAFFVQNGSTSAGVTASFHEITIYSLARQPQS